MRRIAQLAVIVLALVLGGVVSPAHASSEGLSVGYSFGPVTELTDTENGGHGCRTTVGIWVMETGESGITQLQAKFELISGSGFSAGGLLDYNDSGWLEGSEFPDDLNSYFTYFGYRVNYPAGGEYRVKVTIRGHRGFFRPPRSARWEIPAGCSPEMIAEAEAGVCGPNDIYCAQPIAQESLPNASGVGQTSVLGGTAIGG